jgi:hypothetical protein
MKKGVNVWDKITKGVKSKAGSTTNRAGKITVVS